MPVLFESHTFPLPVFSPFQPARGVSRGFPTVLDFLEGGFQLRHHKRPRIWPTSQNSKNNPQSSLISSLPLAVHMTNASTSVHKTNQLSLTASFSLANCASHNTTPGLSIVSFLPGVCGGTSRCFPRTADGVQAQSPPTTPNSQPSRDKPSQPFHFVLFLSHTFESNHIPHASGTAHEVCDKVCDGFNFHSTPVHLITLHVTYLLLHHC
jgi:hypothetical protein